MKLTCVLGVAGADCVHNKDGECELNGIDAHLDYWAKGECMPKPICSEYKSKAVRCDICRSVLGEQEGSRSGMHGMCLECYRIYRETPDFINELKALAARVRGAR